jgi:alpha-beta hydrolase superfamily lysophospholipase
VGKRKKDAAPASTLFHYWPARPGAEARGRVLIVHGFGEHGARHAEIAKALSAAGYAVWAGDLRGHGRAPGRRGHVARWGDYLADVSAWRLQLPPHPEPLYLLGHSLGGLVALDWAIQHPGQPRGLVLSSPLLGLAFEPPGWRMSLARFVSRVWPGYLQPTGLDPKGLSTVREEVERYQEDPLVHDRASARFFVEFQETQRRLLEHRKPLPCPTLVLFGEDDPIASIATARSWVGQRRAGASMVTFPGGRHELFHEDFAIREAAMKAVMEFLGALERDLSG